MKIIFLGSQGSGKSTQARLAAEYLGAPHIEMGQLFRDKAKQNDQVAMAIKEALDLGNLVPDDVANTTLKERLSKPDCATSYVLDGFPRNYAQVEGLPQDIDKVFYIKVSDNEGIKRLLERARHDDNLDSITRRLELYHKETEPLLSYFKQKGILVEINGERSIEAIHDDIVKELEKIDGKT